MLLDDISLSEAARSRECFAGWFRHVRLSALGALFAALMSAAPARAIDVPASLISIDRELDVRYPHLELLYKDIHRFPELGLEETRTAALLATEMRALGFSVTEHVGQTGLVAVYRNGPGPTVMVRTELDALPVEEKTGLVYASHVHIVKGGVSIGVGHMCGHDLHMAAWVGTAQVLLALKQSWHGTLMFIAQPAEESQDAHGARRMIDDRLFARFGKPDYGFALHAAPAPAGLVFYGPGVATSNADTFTIRFKGRGGHGADPSATVDPVLEAGRFIVDVQSVVSREKPPGAFGVVTVGQITGGSAPNVIPDDASVSGTIRSYDPQVRAKLIDGVKRTAQAIGAMAAAPEPEIVFSDDAAAAVYNDPALAARTGAVFKQAFGSQAIVPPGANAASEDFSAFIAAGVPSQFFGIGVLDPALFADGGKNVPSNHSPYFAPVPKPSIRRGVEAMSLAVMNILS